MLSETREETISYLLSIFYPVISRLSKGGLVKRWMRSIKCVVALLLAVCGGCSMISLRQDLKVIDDTTRISGSVITDAPLGKPIIVALYKKATGSDPAALDGYQVMYGPGEFTFLKKPGDYYLIAFEDRNENFTLHQQAKAGWHGEPSLIEARPGRSYVGLQIVLQSAADAREKLPPLYTPETPKVTMMGFTQQNGVVAPLSAQRFAPEYGSKGMWEPLEFLKDPGAGLFFQQPYDEEKIPVLFVHGIGGYPQLFSFLIERLDTSRFQPWVVQYPSGVRLDLLGEGLASYMTELYFRHKFPKLIIVAHSMGGLVSRRAINRLTEGGADFVKLFVSISSPWQGDHAAALGVAHSPVVMPCWYDLVPGSPFLKGLQEAPLPGGLRYCLMFGYRGRITVFGHEDNDGTLTLSSMLDLGMQDAAAKVFAFNEDHDSILNSQAVSERLNLLLTDAAR